MTIAKLYSAQNVLLGAQIIKIEIDLSKGLNAFSIVGLPDKAVEESRDRVAAAVKNSGFKSPKIKNQKVIVSLSPADLKKEGPIFDLGIALCYLLSCNEIRFDPKKKLFLGELSLDGSLNPLKGVLPLAQEAKRKGFEEIYLPKENASEAALIGDLKIFGAMSLKEVIAHINQKRDEKFETPDWQKKLKLQERTKINSSKNRSEEISLDDIKGQESAKRGLLVAAAGGHNLAMFGPPGTGKTMLAKAFAGLLPPMTFDEILEITAIHSISGNLLDSLITRPPFRAPHHTSSHVSIIGGGANPRPGEITLAHCGVLFLDEFPEFERRVMESLRQPLEDRVVNISRARTTARFPADFILIAAMNPCPCGNFGVKNKECICTPLNINRYQRKISGPIMDRIDLWLEVSKVDYQKLSETGQKSQPMPGSAQQADQTQIAREKIATARQLSQDRFKQKNLRIKLNSELPAKNIMEILALGEALKEKYNKIAQKLDLSARAYHRVLKVARTIGDLDGSENIKEEHILEALQYRPKAVYSL